MNTERPAPKTMTLLPALDAPLEPCEGRRIVVQAAQDLVAGLASIWTPILPEDPAERAAAQMRNWSVSLMRGLAGPVSRGDLWAGYLTAFPLLGVDTALFSADVHGPRRIIEAIADQVVATPALTQMLGLRNQGSRAITLQLTAAVAVDLPNLSAYWEDWSERRRVLVALISDSGLIPHDEALP